ncbi:MAG: hypothetical protein IT373_00565 [Polyangiaceae bacterium]|nr:hypothetical protein [Polyangiaceae bacterium]
MSDPHRAAILRRRALFVTSALGALGCAGPRPTHAEGGSAPSGAVVSVPTASGESPLVAATASPSTSPSSPAPAPVGKLPPLDVPADVSDAARPYFEHLATAVPEVHAALDALPVPRDCPIDKPACEAAWKELAAGLVELDERIGRLEPRCPGSSTDAQRFAQRLAAHRAHIAERRAALVAAVATTARWVAMFEAAEQAVPRVCLKYACRDW